MDLKKLLIDDTFNKTLSFISARELIRLDCYNPQRGYIHPFDGLFYAINYNKTKLLPYFNKELKKWLKRWCERCSGVSMTFTIKIVGSIIIQLPSTNPMYKQPLDDHVRNEYNKMITLLLEFASSEGYLEGCGFLVYNGANYNQAIKHTTNKPDNPAKPFLQAFIDKDLEPNDLESLQKYKRGYRKRTYVNPYYLRR